MCAIIIRPTVSGLGGVFDLDPELLCVLLRGGMKKVAQMGDR